MLSIGETTETVGRLLFDLGLDAQFVEVQPGVATVHTESGLPLALLAIRRGWLLVPKPDGFDMLADRYRLEVRTSGPRLDVIDSVIAESQQTVRPLF